MAPTPEQEQLAQDENLAVMSTVRKDGTAQVTPINFAYVEGKFLVSTTKDRAKYHNVKRDSSVVLCIVQHATWHPYATVYGTAQIEEHDVAAGTAEIFKRIYPDRPVPDNFADILKQQKRVLIVITPDRFTP
jgi:PPOX class probable F420-dependent enzyme